MRGGVAGGVGEGRGRVLGARHRWCHSVVASRRPPRGRLVAAQVPWCPIHAVVGRGGRLRYAAGRASGLASSVVRPKPCPRPHQLARVVGRRDRASPDTKRGLRLGRPGRGLNRRPPSTPPLAPPHSPCRPQRPQAQPERLLLLHRRQARRGAGRRWASNALQRWGALPPASRPAPLSAPTSTEPLTSSPPAAPSHRTASPTTSLSVAPSCPPPTCCCS